MARWKVRATDTAGGKFAVAQAGGDDATPRRGRRSRRWSCAKSRRQAGAWSIDAERRVAEVPVGQVVRVERQARNEGVERRNDGIPLAAGGAGGWVRSGVVGS